MPEYKILVVDDDVSVRNICRKVLKQITEKIDFAESAEQARDNIKNADYDCVILDISLPGMAGDEFLKEAAREFVYYYKFWLQATYGPV